MEPIVEDRFGADVAIGNLDLNIDILRVTVENMAGKIGVATFDNLRMFLFFKESDLFKRMALYEHSPVIVGPDPTLGIFLIKGNSMISLLTQGELDIEEPYYYWISTPDHCLEIASFSMLDWVCFA